MGLKIKLIILSEFFIISFFNARGQQIDSTIEKYANQYGQEKIYLHYDKSSYAPGEIIWYKAYIMSGISPADESKNFYVDWTDDKGKLLAHNITPVQYASSSGQFDIPADYAGKYLHVKAYTKWMLNFDTAFLYDKDIRILSKNPAATVLKNTAIPSLQFFPEGGDIISGLTNKVAFKVNDQWGRPMHIKGIIQDKFGKKVDSIRIIHDGMGYIYLNPKPGETFTARWFVISPLDKNQKTEEHITELPAIKPTGISLQVIIDDKKRIFLVNASPASAAGAGTIHVIGTMNQHEIFKLDKDFSAGLIKGSVPTGDLPSGILTITVFNNDWVPVAERITYINNQEYLFNIEMNVEHWGLSKRARNEIEIIVPDSLQANFSVAVTDIKIDADSSDNIISHLLLTGDLKGTVYNPSWYFSDNADSMSSKLDLVMLTHGWRRFKWDDVVAGKFPKINYPKDSSYFTLSGKIYGVMPSQLRDAGDLILIMQKKKNENKMAMVPVRPNGTFNDPSFILFDTTTIYYKLAKEKGAGDISVQFLENRLAPFAYNNPASGMYYNQLPDTAGHSYHLRIANDERESADFFSAKVLETVVLKSKTKSPVEILDEKYASGLFSGGDAYQFDLLNDPTSFSSMNILNYLQGKVAGLQISTGNPPSLQWRGSTPQIYIDEAPTDVGFVTSLSVNDVAYVKVLRPPFFGGFGGGAGGAIAIYTRKGDERRAAPGKGLNHSLVRGYNSMKEFFSPNYGTISAPNDQKDLRTTLYWNPQVLTTRLKNKALLKFYNNDISKAFRVVIEGMSNDGRLVHFETIME